MKKIIIGISAVFVIALAGNVSAADTSHDMGHGMAMESSGSGGMDMKMDMGESAHGGETIRTGVVDGYGFAYQLMDIRQNMAAMKAAGHAHEGMDATHHLMVHISDPEGGTVENARVGYLVTGPDGSEQKAMCMAMGGGYGSDLKLGETGEYTIKTKVVDGEVKLVDEFVYKVED